MARPSSGTGLTISQLQQILSHRKGESTNCIASAAQFEKELAKIDRQIGKLEGTGSGGRRGGGGSGVRAHNDKSLVETLVEVLQDSKARWV